MKKLKVSKVGSSNHAWLETAPEYKALRMKWLGLFKLWLELNTLEEALQKDEKLAVKTKG